jgi:hypothetical protein
MHIFHRSHSTTYNVMRKVSSGRCECREGPRQVRKGNVRMFSQGFRESHATYLKYFPILKRSPLAIPKFRVYYVR